MSEIVPIYFVERIGGWEGGTPRWTGACLRGCAGGQEREKCDLIRASMSQLLQRCGRSAVRNRLSDNPDSMRQGTEARRWEEGRGGCTMMTIERSSHTAQHVGREPADHQVSFVVSC